MIDTVNDELCAYKAITFISVHMFVYCHFGLYRDVHVWMTVPVSNETPMIAICLYHLKVTY